MGVEETKVQNEVRVRHSKVHRGILFRNNVGVAVYPGGSVVVYGLCTGSSDTIGLTPVKITPEMVGQELAVFTAFETKRPRRAKKPTAEQLNFVARIQAAGGIAGVVQQPEQIDQLVADYLARICGKAGT